MKNLIIVIQLLLTFLLVGCADKAEILASIDESIYVGEKKDGEPNGQGTLTWKYGRKYVGGFKHGQETYNYPSGRKYMGELKEGKTWTGIFYDKNGNISFKRVNGKKR